MNKFFAELRRRSVFRVAGLYFVVGWLVAQMAIALETSLGLPSWFDAVIVSAIIIGFPIALVIAWAFEVTPEGMRHTTSIDGKDVPSINKMDVAIILGLVVVAGMIVSDRFLPKTPSASTPAQTLSSHEPGNEAAANLSPQISEDGDDMSAITLAVLPFTNMSSDRSQDYFADGLTDELITALSRISALSVASRTSTFRFKQAADLRDVGEQLGVHYILEGGVQRADNQMRINVQLIDTETGAHIWAESYDLVIANLFDVQDDIVTTVANELRPQLYNAAKRAIAARATKSPSAWALYMEAIWSPGQITNSLNWERQRADLARQAVEIDPGFGQAHAVLADKLAFLASVDPEYDTDKIWAEAEQHAKRAIELAPQDADAVFNVAMFNWHSGRLKQALEGVKRTLEIDPNHTIAYLMSLDLEYTCVRAPQSVIDNVIAFDQSLSANNPVRYIVLINLAFMYMNNGEYALAAESAERSRQIFQSLYATYVLAAAQVQLGQADEAIALITQERKNWPTLDPRHFTISSVPKRCGGGAETARLEKIYGELADVIEAAEAR